MDLRAILTAIFGRVGAIYGIVTEIYGIVSGAATSQQLADLSDQVAAIHDLLTDPSAGLLAIADDINTLTTDVTTGITTIEADIALVQQTGSPVTLPTTPPTGYGGGSGASPSDIWAFSLPGSGQAASDQLDNAGNLSRNMSVATVALPLTHASFFTLGGTWYSSNSADNSLGSPIWDTSSLLPTDDLVTFLDRVSGYTGWALDQDEHAWVRQDTAFNDFIYTSTMDARQFLVYRDSLLPAAAGLVPPIWPGLAAVTFGPDTPISEGFTVGGPMDGVIVEIDSVPTGTNFFDFDGRPSYRNLGSLAFSQDTDTFEAPQNLGFGLQIYSPKSMKRANTATFRVKSGVSGTVTPWVITS